jgi:hypothetical protein
MVTTSANGFDSWCNIDRDPKDLPVLSKTYMVYHYNYQRGTSEAVEDHRGAYQVLRC